MPKKSSLSTMSLAVYELVKDEFKKLDDSVIVLMGTPVEEKGANDKKNKVNIFFYKFEPSGFYPDGKSDEPWLIRLHCLITVFGDKTGEVSAGENELRMLGHVMRIFHEKPVMDKIDVSGHGTRLQVIFRPLNNEDLNQIWSIQGDSSYHPSVVYEMALGPIMPMEPSVGVQRVGSIGKQLIPRIDAIHEPYSGGRIPPPLASASEVNINAEDWASRICFVKNDDGVSDCIESCYFLANSAELNAFSPKIWVVGDPDMEVSLKWEVWDKAGGWRVKGPGKKVNPESNRLDPENIPDDTKLEEFPLPFDEGPGEPESPPVFLKTKKGQAMLYAERTFTRKSNGAQVTVRSNPLLVSIYEPPQEDR